VSEEREREREEKSRWRKMREFALIKGLMFLGLGSTWLWSPLQLNKRCNACHSRCIALCRAHVLLCRRFEAHSHRLHAVSQRPDQIGIVRYPILLLKLARYARKLCLLLRAPAPAPSLLTLKLLQGVNRWENEGPPG